MEYKTYTNEIFVKKENKLNKSIVSLLICSSFLGYSTVLNAAPITAPTEITGNEVWGTDSPITIDNNNGININGGNLTLNNVETNITKTKNGGYGFIINNNGKLTINGGNFTHSSVANASPSLKVRNGSVLIVDGLTLMHSSVSTLKSENVLTVDEAATAIITDSNFTTTGASMMRAINGTINISNSRLHLQGATGATNGLNASIQALNNGQIIGDGLTVISDVINTELDNSVLFLGSAGVGGLQLTNSNITVNKGQTIFRGSIIGDGLTLNYISNTADGAKGNIATKVGSGSVLQLDNTVLNVSGDLAGLGVEVYSNGQLVGNKLTINAYDEAQAIKVTRSDSSVDLINSVLNNESDTLSALRISNSGQAKLHNTVINANGYAMDSIDGQAIVNVSGSQTLIGGKVGALKVLADNADAGLEMNLSDSASMVGNASTSQANNYEATLNINLLSNANWQGAANNIDNDVKSGVINVSIDNAAWVMGNNSSIDTLELLNSGVVALSNGDANSGQTVLTVNELSGQGQFRLHADIVGDGAGNNHGDLLRVTGSSAGSYMMTVVNNGSAMTDGTETLTVVETADGNAEFAMSSQVELGGYVYDLRKAGSDWELYGAGEVPVITSPADASVNFLNIGYLMNYAETQTLLQRMGDLRQNGERGDMWIRGFAGKFDSFSGGKLSRFDMSYSGFQIGADKRISAEMPLFVGLFMGQTHGSPDYRTGDGTVKSNSGGIYGSYMAPNGFYVDAVAKYSNISNKFSVRDSQDVRVSGKGNSDGISLSLEIGQKFNLSEQNGGFYIEPQAQLTYGQQSSVHVKASNGLNVDLDSYESLMGRASALFGYEMNQGSNKVNVYLKTGIMREFDGDVDYKLNGSTEKHTFKGNWWNNGIGVSAQIGEQHTLYLDVDSSTGNKFDQRQINGGYRFSF